MNPTDFEGMFKYKLFLPVLYLVNWALMVCGPLLFPIHYQMFTIVVFGYMLLKTIFNFAWCLVGFRRALQYMTEGNKALRRREEPVSEEVGVSEQPLVNHCESQVFYHLFIIPSYCEDIGLLRQTIGQLAVHTAAKQRYLVALAMQAHEQGSVDKAKQLIAEKNNSFKSLTYTHHSIRPYQQRGKASNVSWCAEQLEQTVFSPLNICLESTIVTIIDADSWTPQLYMQELDCILKQNPSKKHSTIFQPSQLFTRNHLEVPLLTRTYDQSHSLVHFCNLVTCFNASFPLSNYSMSFSLIKEVGFWDTCADAIGEDFHMTIKAFWKTEGNIRTEYIHIPFNQLNVQTGQGYCSDLCARFWQAQRHARGCADAAYCLKMLIERQVSVRCLLISFQALECFVLPAIIPWALVGSTAQSIRYSWFEDPPVGMVPGQYVSYMFNLCTLLFLISYGLYFYLKRRVTREMYNLQNESLWRIIEFPIMILPNLFLVSFPTFTLAAFRVLFNQHQYTVAQKKVSRV